MNFSVCTDSVFHGLDTAKAIETCANLGFYTIEFWGVGTKDMKGILEAAKAHNVAIAGFSTKHSCLIDPSARDTYLDGLKESVKEAKDAGAHLLISQVGQETDAPRHTQHESIVNGLKAAAEILDGTGITLVVEPLNTLYNHPGYYLSSSKEGFDIIKEVGSPCVKLLFDIYHQQVTEGNIINSIRDNLAHIGHIHAAGHPGRNELTKGELNYGAILSELESMGYNGLVGLEYFPSDGVTPLDKQHMPHMQRP